VFVVTRGKGRQHLMRAGVSFLEAAALSFVTETVTLRAGYPRKQSWSVSTYQRGSDSHIQGAQRCVLQEQ